MTKRSKKTMPDIVAEHPLFVGTSPDAQALIAGCTQNVRFRPDQMLLREGDPADVFYLIKEGRVAIEVDTPRRGPMTVETLGPGDVVGVWWLLPPYRSTFVARAVTPTGAIAVDAACLRGKCDDDPVFGFDMFKRFAGVVRDRLQAARLQLLDVDGNDAS